MKGANTAPHEAYIAIARINSGQWDRFILLVRQACAERMSSDEFKRWAKTINLDEK